MSPIQVWWIRLLALCFSGVFLAGASAQETVSVSTPSFVSFSVVDVGQNSTGSPNPATINFSNADLSSGMSLSISVMADTSEFIPPSGSGIAASNITWVVTGASGGSGFNGTLSDSSYTEVYRSTVDPASGSVELRFRLTAPGAGIDAGEHDLALRWRFESVL